MIPRGEIALTPVTPEVLAAFNNEDIFDACLDPTKDSELNNRKINYVKIFIAYIKEAHVDNYQELMNTILSSAISKGNNEIARMVIDSPDTNLDLFNNLGRSPLIHAIELRNNEIASILIKSKRCDLNIKSKIGDTALGAAAFNSPEIALQLIESKADVSIPYIASIPGMDAKPEDVVAPIDISDDLRVIYQLLLREAKPRDSSRFLENLFSISEKYRYGRNPRDLRDPNLLSCLTIFCKQQQELRDANPDDKARLSDKEFNQAKKYLDKLDALHKSHAEQTFDHLNAALKIIASGKFGPLSIINGYDAPLERISEEDFRASVSDERVISFKMR